MKWFWKNKFHFLIWAVMIVYLFSASQINAAFFLKNGKPITTSVTLPAEKGQIIVGIEDLQSRVYGGEEVYAFYGWVFDAQIPESASFVKKVVLHSEKENLIFPAESLVKDELNGKMPKYKMDLDHAGFRAVISKHALKPGNYRVGFILEDAQGNIRSFKMFDKYIERDPNSLRYIGN